MYQNANLKNLDSDFLYHLGITNANAKELYGDVKYVCCGGSASRMFVSCSVHKHKDIFTDVGHKCYKQKLIFLCKLSELSTEIPALAKFHVLVRMGQTFDMYLRGLLLTGPSLRKPLPIDLASVLMVLGM